MHCVHSQILTITATDNTFRPTIVYSYMKSEIHDFITSLDEQSVAEERRLLLQKLIDFIQAKKDADESIKLNFICTHNSRRSHMCQVWAKVIGQYYGLEKVKSYSGGTEATAVYPTVIKTFESLGFEVTKIANYSNPTYKLNFTEEHCPMTLFSKRHNDRYNPRKEFAAVMTCTDADQNCPIIPNAERISLPYIDPKLSDGTKDETRIYSERSTQIATELKFAFSQIK